MGLYHNILNDPVSELQLREVIAVAPDTTCREAVATMKQKCLGYAVVLDSEGRPLGMFTERMLIRLLLSDSASLDDPVENHISGRAMRIRRDEPIAKLIQTMQSLGWRFVCVVDEQNRAVGVTGQRGVLEYLTDHFPRSVKVQRMSTEFFSGQREGA